MKKGIQRALLCPCGRSDIVARGLCGTCYTLKRRDEAYFGGLREQVLQRDGRRCRACGKPGGEKRSITVHHRVPGKSVIRLMISLCPKCHATVERLRVVRRVLPELLLVLWREKHPDGIEQLALDFQAPGELPATVDLFDPNSNDDVTDLGHCGHLNFVGRNLVGPAKAGTSKA